MCVCVCVVESFQYFTAESFLRSRVACLCMCVNRFNLKGRGEFHLFSRSLEILEIIESEETVFRKRYATSLIEMSASPVDVARKRETHRRIYYKETNDKRNAEKKITENFGN